MSQWHHLGGIKFQRFVTEEKAVGIFIGNDVPEAHWVYEERREGQNQPYAVRIPLGWMLISHLDSSLAARAARVNFIRGS